MIRKSALGSILCVICIALLMQACARTGGYPRHRLFVSVNALASPEAKGKLAFVIVPADSTTSIHDLQYQEYASYLARALQLSGYQYAESLIAADLVVALDCGVGEPHFSIRNFILPTYGATGVKTTSTLGSFMLFGNTGTFTSTTTQYQQYGLTSFQNYQTLDVTFQKYVALSAIDFRKFQDDGVVREVWRTTITATGRDAEFRSAFPLMVAAAVEFYGKSPGRTVRGYQSSGSPATLYVLGHHSEPVKINGNIYPP